MTCTLKALFLVGVRVALRSSRRKSWLEEIETKRQHSSLPWFLHFPPFFQPRSLQYSQFWNRDYLLRYRCHKNTQLGLMSNRKTFSRPIPYTRGQRAEGGLKRIESDVETRVVLEEVGEADKLFAGQQAGNLQIEPWPPNQVSRQEFPTC